MMTFSLTDEQWTRLREWEAEQDRIVVEKQRAKAGSNPFLDALNANDIAYYGAIGGQLTFMFSPNSIGEIVVVKHGGTAAAIDLTDYDSW